MSELSQTKEWVESSLSSFDMVLRDKEERDLEGTSNYLYVKGLRDFAQQVSEIITIEQSRLQDYPYIVKLTAKQLDDILSNRTSKMVPVVEYIRLNVNREG
jgi:hypothetical protein